MPEKKGNLYLISGFIIGLLFGLIYSWLIDPVEFIDAAPSAMGEEYKDDYREMIAMAYSANQDLGRAQSRLALLQEDDQIVRLSTQGQLLQGDATKIREARAMVQLSEDLQSYALTGSLSSVGNSLSADAGATADPNQPTQAVTENTQKGMTDVTAEPAATEAVQTNDPKNEGLFQLDQKMEVCDPNLPQGLLQVVVVDANGNPIPGVRGTVYWEGGSDYFYTGLYPDLGDGYGDYVMKATVQYKLQIGEGSALVEEVTPPICTADNGKEYFGSMWMQFQRMQ